MNEFQSDNPKNHSASQVILNPSRRSGSGCTNVACGSCSGYSDDKFHYARLKRKNSTYLKELKNVSNWKKRKYKMMKTEE